MSTALFRGLVALIGALFALAFGVIVMPAFLENPDVVGAFAAGFVNPFAAGYALDAIACWCILAVWVVFEAKEKGIRFGWIALALGVVPGVAVGLSLYLLIRQRQLRSQANGEALAPLP